MISVNIQGTKKQLLLRIEKTSEVAFFLLVIIVKMRDFYDAKATK